MKFKKIIFTFVICFIFVLGFAFAQECGDGICEEGEEVFCSEDCPLIPESGICGDGLCEFDEPTYCPQDCPDISEEEYLLETFGSEYSPAEEQLEESGLIPEQTNLPVDESPIQTENQETNEINVFGFSLNLVLYAVSGVIVFIIIGIIIFIILKKKKTPILQEENVSQTPTINQQ